MQRFIGSVVVITGAARGIGQAMALRLAQEGARVAVLDLADLSQTAALCRQAGAEVIARTLDVSRRADILAAVEAILAAWGRLDVWVNNAGVFDDTPLAELSEDRWQQVIDVNTKAMFLCCQAVAPTMLAQGRGRIVNLSSMAAKVAFPNEVAYCSSKAAVLGLTRALAVELGREGITVNCICPGPINTAMTARVDPKDKETYARRRTALRRYGDPEEVAQMTVSLCLPAASFLTGATIPVDGGLTIRRA